MKILALSDIDDFHWKYGTGQADIVLSCGDVSDQVILEAAQAYVCPIIFAVKGNHDSNAQFPKPIIDLHLHVENYNGMKFGGLNGSWKYKPMGYFLYDQSEVDRFLSAFPPVDIFLAHNSPKGIHDKEDDVHYGFDGLKSYLLRVIPKLLIHGHQHVDRETQLGQTRIVGICGYKLIVT